MISKVVEENTASEDKVIRHRLYAYPREKEYSWIANKVKQFKKRDPQMSNSKVIIALIKEKMKSPDRKAWDPREGTKPVSLLERRSSRP